MSSHRLLLASVGGLEESQTDFLWSAPGHPSSFDTSIGPGAAELGPVPWAAVDLVRLATLVYLVDRTTPRPKTGSGDRWQRELELTLPVIGPADDWNLLAPLVGDLLAFLTGDSWTLSFEQGLVPERNAVEVTQNARVVSLFSGGADSFIGALRAADIGAQSPILVSHSDWSITTGAQNEGLRQLNRVLGTPQTHLLVRIGRRKQQVGRRADFREEPSSRSRSLLFLSIAIAVASARGMGEVAIPENGFMALNLPLAPERKGALSTRTTHPRLMAAINELTGIIGLNVRIINPFAEMTKGQMFAWARGKFGDRIAESLAATRSCARSGFNYRSLSPSSQCGVCMACLVRRAAFIAAKLPDTTEYVDVGKEDQLPAERRSDLDAVRYAIRRGFDSADLLALRLPENFSVALARSVIETGLGELSAVPGL